MTTKNVLTLKQQVELHEWLHKLAAEFREEGSQRTEIAAKATKELGYQVTTSNVNTLAKACDIDLGRGRSIESYTRGASSRKDRIRRLAKIVQVLYKELGVDQPRDLQQLVTGNLEITE